MGEMADFYLEMEDMFEGDGCWGDCGTCNRRGYTCDGEDGCGPPIRLFPTKLEKGIKVMTYMQGLIASRIAWRKKHATQCR